MATRNLARTVIEVGRTKWSKEGRRRLRRAERRAGRRFCHEAECLDDLDDLRSAPVGLRKGWDFAQDDKLGPARRWMDSRVGRPWDEVFSELSVKFRNRGIALSHVVDTHMLSWVDTGNKEKWWGAFDYEVDDEGILRFGPDHDKPGPKIPPRPRNYLHALRWADGRKVIVRGRRCYWSNPDRWVRDTWGTGNVTVTYESHRQGPEFSQEDYEVWATLGSYAKESVSLAAYSLRD